MKFADAYLVDSAEELSGRRFKSVTTVMALTAPETVSTADDLIEDHAVMQDLTRETIQDRYPDIPVIPPQRAAEHLFSIAREYDFTLFEFFQTDVVFVVVNSISPASVVGKSIFVLFVLKR